MSTCYDIGVIYTHFPHYRAAVFDALARSDHYGFTFFYDFGGIDATIESGARGARHHALPVRRLGPFFWQGGSIALAAKREFDALIFCIYSMFSGIFFYVFYFTPLFVGIGYLEAQNPNRQMVHARNDAVPAQ